MAGLGGVLYTARYAQVDTLAGAGLELNVIAAVVIGGTSTLGGSGGILGTLIGCVLLGVINNALILVSSPGTAQFWQRAVYGLIILGAVVADALISRRLQKALRRREKAGKVERPGARPRRPAHGEDEGGVGDRPDRQRGPRDAGSVHGPAV